MAEQVGGDGHGGGGNDDDGGRPELYSVLVRWSPGHRVGAEKEQQDRHGKNGALSHRGDETRRVPVASACAAHRYV